MAYLPYEDEDQRRGQAIAQTGGGAPMAQGGQIGAAPSGQQKAPAGTSSGQFTNLQAFMDAGSSANRVAGVQKAGASLLDAEQGKIDAETKKMQGATFNPQIMSEQDVQANLGSEAGQRKIGAALNQQANGPTFNYEPAAQTKNELNALQSAGTISDVVAKDSIAAGNYSLGSRRLDSALYGLDSGVRDAQAKLADRGKAMGASVEQARASAKATAEAMAGEAAQARAKTLAALYGYEGKLREGLDARVAAAQTADAQGQARAGSKTRQEYYNEQGDLLSDADVAKMTTAQKNALRSRTMKDTTSWRPGTGATAGNTVTADEARQFAALAKFLGQNPYATQTGTYGAGQLVTGPSTVEQDFIKQAQDFTPGVDVSPAQGPVLQRQRAAKEQMDDADTREGRAAAAAERRREAQNRSDRRETRGR